MLFKFFLQILGQFRIFTIIHRAVDDTRNLLPESILQNRDQILCLFHTLSFGMHAFRILHEIRIREIHIAVLSKMIDLLPLNQTIAGI